MRQDEEWDADVLRYCSHCKDLVVVRAWAAHLAMHQAEAELDAALEEARRANETPLVPVTHELLQKMRAEGKGFEANQLYRQWLKCCAKQRKVDKMFVEKEMRRIEYRRAVNAGICLWCRDEPVAPGGNRFCVECSVRRSMAKKGIPLKKRRRKRRKTVWGILRESKGLSSPP